MFRGPWLILLDRFLLDGVKLGSLLLLVLLLGLRPLIPLLFVLFLILRPVSLPGGILSFLLIFPLRLLLARLVMVGDLESWDDWCVLDQVRLKLEGDRGL